MIFYAVIFSLLLHALYLIKATGIFRANSALRAIYLLLSSALSYGIMDDLASHYNLEYNPSTIGSVCGILFACMINLAIRSYVYDEEFINMTCDMLFQTISMIGCLVSILMYPQKNISNYM